MSAQGQHTSVNHLVLNSITGAVANKTLFEGVIAQVSSGQLLRISGDNGAGKSTLLRMIVGLLEIEAGEIRWNDQPIDDSDFFQADLSYVGHKDGLKGERTAIENLAFYQQLYQKYEQNLDQLLFDFNLLEQAEILAKHLSFGQRRRLALLRLALSQRSLWIVDEPFTGVDVNARKLIENLFTSHLEAGGIIVMTHHGDLTDTSLASYLHEVAL
jgi:heme exporter protein A